MKQYKSDRSCLNILRFVIILTALLLICTCTYFLSFIPKLMIFLNIIFAVTAAFVVIIYLPVYFGHLRYIVSENKIIKISGFFFIKKQIMPFDTVQYVSSVSTPLYKLTRLNFIVLYAYGGIMTIIFLNRNDFEELSFKFRK